MDPLAASVERALGRLHEGVAVTGVERSNGSVVAVRTSAGALRCRAVVIAAGTWSAGLLRDLGHRLPLQAGKGYSFSVHLGAAPRHPLYKGLRSGEVAEWRGPANYTKLIGLA